MLYTLVKTHFKIGLEDELALAFCSRDILEQLFMLDEGNQT